MYVGNTFQFTYIFHDHVQLVGVRHREGEIHEILSLLGTVAVDRNDVYVHAGQLLADLRDRARLVLCVDMLLGRLEIYPLIMLFAAKKR